MARSKRQWYKSVPFTVSNIHKSYLIWLIILQIFYTEFILATHAFRINFLVSQTRISTNHLAILNNYRTSCLDLCHIGERQSYVYWACKNIFSYLDYSFGIKLTAISSHVILILMIYIDSYIHHGNKLDNSLRLCFFFLV